VEESTIPALPDAPVNLKELEQALEIDGAHEIAAGFLEDVASIPEKLSRAVNSKDKEAIRSAAHLLKGCCLIIMAQDTAEKAARMERQAGSGELEHCEQLLPELLQSLQNTVKCLEAYIDES